MATLMMHHLAFPSKVEISNLDHPWSSTEPLPVGKKDTLKKFVLLSEIGCVTLMRKDKRKIYNCFSKAIANNDVYKVELVLEDKTDVQSGGFGQHLMDGAYLELGILF
ncbi:hypothetical protein PIB30_064794 [Stylosanthes scabra]|uniref:Uncharacterized protein n=1 Tax=Stylosanthes scabra TaxID=79078 RepID=A0ABU6XN72_9FABA|nr:hypothetical protein [Stylosanthes scabra]